MNFTNLLLSLTGALLISLPACSDDPSPTGPVTRAKLLARYWSGDEFFMLNVESKQFRAKDLVQELTFASDGSYYFYKPSMSTIVGRSGVWILENFGASLRLVDQTGHSESFVIQELTSDALILGDTTSRGFALVPYSKYGGLHPR